MAKIEIHNLGPINNCQMDIEQFTVLTGAQASGKSTIAKAVFFCRTVKDDIFDAISRRTLLGTENTLSYDVIKILRNKFLQLFGTSKAMSADMRLIYHYDDVTKISVSLKMQEGYDFISPNYVWIDFSDNIHTFLKKTFDEETIKSGKLRRQINEIFKDEYEAIFIPAGRSLISLLTSQLNYLFTTMDDDQKRSIDFCTQKYIERILKIRPLFENGVGGMIEQKRNTLGAKIDTKVIGKMLDLVQHVLKGKYVFKDGEERLYIDEEHFVKINYTSSGQQETVWIFNILLHILTNNTKAYIILEEPEAHLYPEAQKCIIEMLAMMGNCNCEVLVTTHSPYVLGALNNLIYAEALDKKCEGVDKEVDKMFYIKNHEAYFLEKGKIRSCLDAEDHNLIINEVIDGASTEINEVYDKLFHMDYEQRSNT